MKILETLEFTNLPFTEDVGVVTKAINETTVPINTIGILLLDPTGTGELMRSFKAINKEKQVAALQDRESGLVFPVTALRSLNEGRLLAFIAVGNKIKVDNNDS